MRDEKKFEKSGTVQKNIESLLHFSMLRFTLGGFNSLGSLQFFDILQQIGLSESPNDFPFHIFGTIRLFQKPHFSSAIRLTQYIPTNIFFNTIRNLDVMSGVKRYIRIFDVISKLCCVLLRRRRRIENVPRKL